MEKIPILQDLIVAAAKERNKGRIRLKERTAALIVLYFGKIFGPSVHLFLKSGWLVLTQGWLALRPGWMILRLG